MSEQKSNAKRDELMDIQEKYQKLWEEEKQYESNAEEGKDKYMVCFPFPYMNGKLHLGHAFSLTKAEFMARYQRMKGKNVLFPFSFHCTGMPIQAAAEKLEKQLKEHGNPPTLPGPLRNEKGELLRSPTQYENLIAMDIPADEIKNFTDPYFWLEYFPPLARTDLRGFGAAVDFRRSFITTDANPYFDQFVRWQFTHLLEQKKAVFGSRHSIFSPKDKNICADHDRSKGEGVKPKEYTIVKLKVQKPYVPTLENVKLPDGAELYFAAATLRPETMYGQTNCWLAPEGKYGAYQINDKDVFVMTERSARNLAFQKYSPKEGEITCLGEFEGKDLFGTALNAPFSAYESIYVLPMMNIDLSKTTGVVTSVPSDSPDDLAAYRDLQKKPKLREKYGLKEEWVNLPLVPIIRTDAAGDMAAEFYLKKFKVGSQNDRQKLEQAHDACYKDGFYSGVMIIGECEGKSVQEAKPLLRKKLMDDNLAIPYFEPEETVIARSGETCVVALTPQWFLTYGEEKWRDEVLDHLNNTFHSYSQMTLDELKFTAGWLHEWGCSREFGLGTRLPSDEKYVIESLSDSTIYMAYYTIAHMLQDGVLNGSKIGPSGLKPEQMTPEVFDYIFLEKKFEQGEGKPSFETLDKMKAEFEYWYPFDLRVSAKDLIKNHLTMCLYNHSAIWGKKYMPGSIFANGYIMVDGEKMSKSQGNFLMMKETVSKYTADAVRFTLAQGGDTHSDANFECEGANAAILTIHSFMELIKFVKDGQFRNDEKNDEDLVFDARINLAIKNSTKAYDEMKYRELIKDGYYEMQSALSAYRIAVGDDFHQGVIERFIEVQTLLLAPIIPHSAEYIWRELLGNKETVTRAAFPVANEVDELLLTKADYMQDALHSLRKTIQNDTKNICKKNKEFSPNRFYLYIATTYNDAQNSVLEVMREVVKSGAPIENVGSFMKPIKKSGVLKKMNKREGKQINAFVAERFNVFEKKGIAAFESNAPFDELAFMREKKELVMKGLKCDHLDIFEATSDNLPDDNRAKRAQMLKPTMSIAQE
mmetsp:Transcript_6865/g.10038  ORF Transcript_6865/g.10038 Transcript_6865/m.10038 type:complete len:1039 (+) Transcript_6865:235-3351(+)